MNGCVNIRCRKRHERIEFWRTQRQNTSSYEKSSESLFFLGNQNKFFILEEIRENLVMFIPQLGCK